MGWLLLQLVRMSHRVDVVLGNDKSASVMQVKGVQHKLVRGVDKVKSKACIV